MGSGIHRRPGTGILTDKPGIQQRLDRAKTIIEKLDRKRHELEAQKSALQRLSYNATGFESDQRTKVELEVDTEIALVNAALETLGTNRTNLESVFEIIEAYLELQRDWGLIINALIKPTKDRDLRGCQMYYDISSYAAVEVLRRLNALLRDGTPEDIRNLISQPTKPAFSGWHLRVDVGSERQSIHPIFGDIIIGHRSNISHPVEIVNDPETLKRYFEAIEKRYTGNHAKKDILDMLSEISKRITIGIFFRDSDAISLLHGLIEVRAGILESSLFLHALGTNPIRLEKNEASREYEMGVRPLATPVQLFGDELVYPAPKEPFYVKLYKPSLELHSLIVSCDSSRSHGDHFKAEIYDVESELRRFAKFGTISKLIGETATIEEFEARLKQHRDLTPDATLIIVINMHGLPTSLSFIDGSMKKKRLLELLEQIPCKKLLIVNACHAGGFWDDIERIPQQTMIASSSKADQVTYGGAFLERVADAFARGEDLKKLDGVKVQGDFVSRRNHEAEVEGMTVILPQRE